MKGSIAEKQVVPEGTEPPKIGDGEQGSTQSFGAEPLAFIFMLWED